VREGTISISAAAAIASLPDEEQKAAVSGGKKIYSKQQNWRAN